MATYFCFVRETFFCFLNGNIFLFSTPKWKHISVFHTYFSFQLAISSLTPVHTLISLLRRYLNMAPQSKKMKSSNKKGDFSIAGSAGDANVVENSAPTVAGAVFHTTADLSPATNNQQTLQVPDFCSFTLKEIKKQLMTYGVSTGQNKSKDALADELKKHYVTKTLPKKRCSSCRAWRDGLAPLSAKGGTSGAAASDVGLVDNDATCHDENGPPNNASPRRDDGSPMKSRGGTKRKSPSRGLAGVLCPSTPPSPPALCSMRRITASPPSECRGISNGFFGQTLTFAARSMQHTVNQLQQWAKQWRWRQRQRRWRKWWRQRRRRRKRRQQWWWCRRRQRRL
jgi:hypothetical protein